MLTKQVLSKGDRVLIIETRSHRSPNPQTVVVDKVTKKFIYCCGKKFDLDGRHVDPFPSFALRDDLTSYQEAEKRDRLISKIKIIANTHRFGEALSTENLEAIAKLIEVQNAN